jgi:hypothetical protein
MRVGNKMALVAMASVVCWLGAISASYGVARAGDAREDQINNEAPDQQADAQLGDSTADSTDALASSGRMQVGGHWSGSITDGVLGAGTLDLLINQHGSSLSGGFDTGFAGPEDFAGALKGTSNKAAVAITLKPNKQRNCRVTLTPTSVSGTEIKGGYSTKKCTGLTGGNFDVLFEHS